MVFFGYYLRNRIFPPSEASFSLLSYYLTEPSLRCLCAARICKVSGSRTINDFHKLIVV
jgi:hypothetical protein